MIKIKRVYEEPEKDDGQRILVDRLWPRGIKKEDLKHDLWMKEIAPSTELRKWYHRNISKWDEFRRKYTAELCCGKYFEDLIEIAMDHDITLLYSARDLEHNHAVVLRNLLEDKAHFYECCKTLRDLY